MKATSSNYLSPDIPRLRIGTGSTKIKILSDVLVVPTSRGYVPALLVLRASTQHVLFVGAISISQKLESIRESRGSLVGCELEIRKVSEDKFSPYELSEING